MPISIPGALAESARKFPNHIAMVSTKDASGNKKTYTYKYVFIFS